MADQLCSTHGWSILESAPSNSALAGVLAGFAFTAGVIYVGRSNQVPDESELDEQAIARHAAARSAQDVQTISLFTAAFIILGLNSFIWGMVAGSRALMEPGVAGGVGSSELCGRVWSQAIIAVGMLSLGAIAMVCNIASLFLWQQSAVLNEGDRWYLQAFLLIVSAAAVVGVIAFVGSDSLNFLQVTYDGHVPMWFTTATLLVTIGGLSVAVYVGARRYFGKTSFATSQTAGLRVKDRMRIPTGLIILYALVGAVAVTAAAHYPGWPKQPSTEIIAVYWILGVIYPVAVVILLARAIPRAQSRRADHVETVQPSRD